MQQTALVTGATGFIGSHLVDELLRQNYKVRAFCHYNHQQNIGWLTPHPNLEIVFGDILDTLSVGIACKNVDIIFHLAALISIPYSYTAFNSFVNTNIIGTKNILECANNTRTIITSTSEVYGTAKYAPIDEDHPISPQSPYAATKVASDALATAFHKSFATPITIVRPFNTYGPRQSTRAIIPQIISQLLPQPKTLKLGSLSPTRDMVYVEDTVQSFINIAKERKTIGETINIATGFDHKVGEIANTLISLMSPRTIIETDNVRIRPKDSEVLKLQGCNTKLLRLTGSVPKTTLDSGLCKTIEWFKANKHLLRNGYIT